MELDAKERQRHVLHRLNLRNVISRRLNKINPRSERQSDLLMPPTDAENWLPRFTNHIKHAGEISRDIFIPWMTLSAENDVGRRECFHKFRRDVFERLGHHTHVGLDTLQPGANFART